MVERTYRMDYPNGYNTWPAESDAQFFKKIADDLDTAYYTSKYGPLSVKKSGKPFGTVYHIGPQRTLGWIDKKAARYKINKDGTLRRL